MNLTIKTLLAHRSVRTFTPQKIDDDIIRPLIDVAHFASGSNHLQCVSIVHMTDANIRNQLKACASIQESPLKVCLPCEFMFFENRCQALEQDKLAEYNAQLAAYYQKRSQTHTDWSRNVSKTLGKPVRPHMLTYLHKQGFAKK